ncbi:MAG: chemotaxis protein CheW, partial [Silvanigrellaceae bacterium]|nr:chemotaxis protein CheW [Silvanigrellaceae bacterium]
EVSGRGVGMDVVKNNIHRLSGTIVVDTELGVGTQFTILLPLSLAVIDALLVGCGAEIYALPQEYITETVRVDENDIVTINSSPSIHLRDEVIPLLELTKILELKPSILDDLIQEEKKRSTIKIQDNSIQKSSSSSKPIVILQIDGLRVGLLVDDLFWQEQIMIKPLGGFLADISVFGGACIMGNGSVILVLQPKELYLTEMKIDRKAIFLNV